MLKIILLIKKKFFFWSLTQQELSHFHFIGSKDLKVEHEHVRSAIVKSASRFDVQYPSQCKAE